MNLNYLDKIIPRRWNLLLRYYLPFFKKPADFHFSMRKIIDDRKKHENLFDLNILLEVLQSIDKHSAEFDSALHELANKIIKVIISNQEDLFDNLVLERLFTRFHPNEAILHKLLIHLPLAFFSNYITKLTQGIGNLTKNEKQYEAQINWCAKLCNKFSFKEKLQLIVLLPKTFIAKQINNINELINSESEHFVNKAFFNLDTELKENFLQFFLEQKTKLTIHDDFFPLLNAYYNFSHKRLINFVCKQLNRLAVEEQLVFLKDLFRYKVAPEETLLTLVFRAYPKEHISQLIDALIFDYFNNPISNNPSLLIPIQKKLQAHSLNLFQMLSISAITKKSFATEILLAAYFDNPSLMDTLAVFSPEIQSLVVEAAIASVQTYISTSIIAKIPRKPEKLNLHSRWGLFIKNECIDPSKTQLQQLNSIIEKIPEDIRKKERVLLNFLLDLYQIYDSPAIRELNEKRKIQADRQAVAYEINQEERREIIKRIALGGQVSHQRMQEVFGKDTQQQENILSKKFNVSFFNGKDKHEYEKARLEAEQMKQLGIGI